MDDQTIIYTNDTLFEGELICRQHKDGYRFSIDPILLAHFTAPRPKSRIIDIGTGCGVICLLLSYRYKDRIASIAGLEVQESLAKLAQINIELNGLQDKIGVQKGDLKNILDFYLPESFDHVFCNPPYYRFGTGRKSLKKEMLVARHQIGTNFSQVAEACAKVVKNKGSVSIIYPSEYAIEAITCLRRFNLETKRMQFVYSYPEKMAGAKLVILEAIKNGGEGCNVLPPFYIYLGKNGDYSSEMKKLYSSNLNTEI